MGRPGGDQGHQKPEDDRPRGDAIGIRAEPVGGCTAGPVASHDGLKAHEKELFAKYLRTVFGLVQQSHPRVFAELDKEAGL